jgi:hypothetical protein
VGYGPACVRKTADRPRGVSTNKLCTQACGNLRHAHYKRKTALKNFGPLYAKYSMHGTCDQGTPACARKVFYPKALQAKY